MDIHATITGERQVELLFEAFPDRVYADLRAEIEALTAELFALVRARTPQRTGRLASEERQSVVAGKDRITGRVDFQGPSGDLAKAGALEYGAHRTTSVRAHSMRLDHVFAERLNGPMSVLVSAYSRTPDIAAVEFERGALDELQPQIIERLNAVVELAAAEANGQ